MSGPTRDTRQRRAVSAALEGSAGFRSAQDIYAQLRAAGQRVGLTTVYRCLAGLLAAGDVDSLRTDEGETLFRRCQSSAHHHHLICRHCGRAVELDAHPVEAWARRVGQDAGFSEVGHTVEVFGRCPSCAR